MEVAVAESDSGRESVRHGDDDELQAVQYPTHHVLAILDTPDQTSCAVDALVNGGFLESEVHVGHGLEQANRLEAGTGRRGFQDWFIRLFQSVGLRNAEIELKDHYEQALRDGKTVVAVLTPTDERKDLAIRLIRDCGGRFVNFYGRLNVERISR
jgi:hypothetical protein